MFIRKSIVLAVLGAVLIAPGAATAHGAAASRCILHEHHVTGVRPYKVEERQGHVTIQQLRGADIYVQAEPGLTAEWLELTLQRHIAGMQTAHMTSCPLDEKDVNVSVTPAQTGFVVTIAARNGEQAREVLHRAEGLVR